MGSDYILKLAYKHIRGCLLVKAFLRARILFCVLFVYCLCTVCVLFVGSSCDRGYLLLVARTLAIWAGSVYGY